MEIQTHHFDSFPILKTKRLTLRQLHLDDTGGIYKMRTNGRVNQFIARPTEPSVEDIENLILKTNKAFDNRQGIGWAGILRDDNSIIGSCGFNRIEYENLRAEIGGELGVNYWGKSIALEAVSAIVQFGLQQLNFHTIEARVSPKNRGAIYLMEQLGFCKEAHYKERVYYQNKFLDMATYTLISGKENKEMMQSFSFTH